MELLLNDYIGRHRLLLLFAHTADQQEYREQKLLLQEHEQEMNERDLLLVELIRNETVLVNGEHLPDCTVYDLREQLNADENMFLVVLVGKDGMELGRYQEPVEPRELFRKVDESPLRRQETGQEDQ